MAKLKLSSYQPALHRKDVRKRVEVALEYFLQFHRSQKEMTWSVPQLEDWFGKHQNDLYGWMRANLLREVRSYSVVKGRAITYTVKQDGFARVFERVHGRAFDYATERARQVEPLLRPYLDAPDPFALMYTKDGDVQHYGQDAATDSRLYWGAAQAVEKVVRRVILRGCWDYDIQAAMPTLILQSVAASKGLDWRTAFPTWARYLGSRAGHRANLADRLGISVQQAKEVFQGMFDLRKFNLGQDGISQVIGRAKTEKALADSTLLALRAEAEQAWGALGDEYVKGKDAGSARFNYYEREERRVMNVVFDRIRAAGGRVLPFHDGFTVLDGLQLDQDGLARLQEEIRQKTGYWVQIDGEKF